MKEPIGSGTIGGLQHSPGSDTVSISWKDRISSLHYIVAREHH